VAGAEATSEKDPLERLEGLLKARLSAESRARLLEIKDFLGLRADDALWSVIGALELYEQLYEEHPARIEQTVSKLLAGVKDTYEAAAAASSAQAQNALAESVTAASEKIAAMRARPLALQAYGLAAAVVTFLCAVSLTAGLALGRAGGRRQEGNIAWEAIRAVLSAPAGWLLFVFLLPMAVVQMRLCWNELGAAPALRKARLWSQLTLWALGIAASLGVLLRVSLGR